MKKIMSLSSGPPADETPQTSILTRMTKTVKYHIRQSFLFNNLLHLGTTWLAPIGIPKVVASTRL